MFVYVYHEVDAEDCKAALILFKMTRLRGFSLTSLGLAGAGLIPCPSTP